MGCGPVRCSTSTVAVPSHTDTFLPNLRSSQYGLFKFNNIIYIYVARRQTCHVSSRADCSTDSKVKTITTANHGLERSMMNLVQLLYSFSDPISKRNMEGCTLAPGLCQPEHEYEAMD